METVKAPPKATVQQSGHWYDREGNPRYTVVGKNGKERPTWVSDARKHGWVPSTTTITKVKAAPALTDWLINQHLDSFFELPRESGDSDHIYRAKIIDYTKKKTGKYAERGTEIHDAIERYYLSQGEDEDEKLHGRRVYGELERYGITFDNVEVEAAFASTFGFGCRVDLLSRELNLILDFKSKEFRLDPMSGRPQQLKEGIWKGSQMVYEDQAMQLAANAVAAELPWQRDGKDIVALNVFISTITDDIWICPHQLQDLLEAWDMFCDLLSYWQKSKKYNTSFSRVP